MPGLGSHPHHSATIAELAATMTGRVPNIERICSERLRLAGALALPPAREP